MTGRSVMDLWFKHWNWPLILNKKGVYRQWPIPYKKYVRNDIYLQYIPINAPCGESFGKGTLDSIRSQVDNARFDALFFKYCFVDFGDKSLKNEFACSKRFENMISLIVKIHRYARKEGMLLILGNALPTLTPGEFGQKLRIQFNRWVSEYASKNHDVVTFDLFNILSDKDGKLRSDFARASYDSHPNNKAFKELDKEFFPILSSLPKKIKSEEAK